MSSHKRNYWFGYALNVVRQWPSLKAEHDELQTQSIIAGYDIQPSGAGGINRKTETIATRELSGRRQREYDAVQNAIDATARMPSGESRLKVIDLVDWKCSHNLTGAAMKLNYSYDAVQNWHADFVHLVAAYLGLKD